MRECLLFGVLCCSMASVLAHSISNSSGAAWNVVLPSSLTEAGSYYDSTIESPANVALLDVSGAQTSGGNDHVDCTLSNPTWIVRAALTSLDTNLSVSVKRTSNGVLVGPSGSIEDYNSNGSYLTLTTTPQTLFCGIGDFTNIAMRYRIEGLDGTNGYGVSSWQINYSITTP